MAGIGLRPTLSGCQPLPPIVMPTVTAVAIPVNNLILDRRRLNVGELVLAASPDGIPTIFADDCEGELTHPLEIISSKPVLSHGFAYINNEKHAHFCRAD